MDVAEAADRVYDAFLTFELERRLGTEQEGGVPESALARLRDATKSALAGHEQLECFVVLELADKVWTLLVVDDTVRLVSVDHDRADICFLGRLDGGDYREERRATDNGYTITSRFTTTDSRLPGGIIELTTTPLPPSSYVSPEARARIENIDKLRSRFREWASSPRVGGSDDDRTAG